MRVAGAAASIHRLVLKPLAQAAIFKHIDSCDGSHAVRERPGAQP
jgi:hypothetical protein